MNKDLRPSGKLSFTSRSCNCIDYLWSALARWGGEMPRLRVYYGQLQRQAADMEVRSHHAKREFSIKVGRSMRKPIPLGPSGYGNVDVDNCKNGSAAMRLLAI